MKRLIVLLTLATIVVAALPATVWAWGADNPNNSDDYINRTATTFRGHELLLHDALMMLKTKRLIPASLGETYLQSMYYGPYYLSSGETSKGYKYLIKGVRIADYDITVPFTGWNIPFISSYEHYYMPSIPWLTASIAEMPGGGWNAKNAFMCYINGGVTIVGKVPEELGAIQRFKNGDITGGFQCLGYAIHYLEDGSMPFHMEWPGAYLPPPVGVDIWNHHGVMDTRGDNLIYNERLQFEKDALERWLPNNDLSFANDALERVDVSGKLMSGPGTTQGYFYKSQNLDDFYHAQASEANSKIQEIVSYYNHNVSPNWTAIDNTIRQLMKRNEERIAQLIFYVFWKANMYPASLTTNRDFAHPNTSFLRVWIPTNYKVTGIIDALGPSGFGTVLLNRCWANDNLTIKSGAGIGKRSTITLVGRDGRKISENTGPYGGEAVLNTSNGSNTGWYTLYVTSPDITSSGNVYVNVYNNAAKDVLNSDPKGKEPPVMKPVAASGGDKTGKPLVGTAKGESPSACEIGYNVGQYSGRYYINMYSYDTDLFWSDMSYSYPGYTNAVMAASCLRFDNFYYDHRIDWKWYRPDGVLYGTNGPTYIYGMYTTGYTWNWWDVWAGYYLKWNGYDYWMQNYQGVWRVEVYIDNNLYTTQYFGVNAPPTITNIASGAYINGGPLEIGTSIKGVPNYASIYLDGTGVEKRVSLDYAAPYSGVVNASILADGAHTAYAYVSSGTPHSAGSKWTPALSFTVDKTKPTVSITAPANGSTYAAGSVITVSANASDAYGVSKVVFYANGKQIASDNASPYSCTYTMTNGAVQVEFIAKAFDRAGNTMVSAKVMVDIIWEAKYKANAMPSAEGWGEYKANSPTWTVSNGILTLSNTGMAFSFFNKYISGASIRPATADFRMRVTADYVRFRLDAINGTSGAVYSFNKSNSTVSGPGGSFALDVSKFHVYRVTMANNTAKLYVDGNPTQNLSGAVTMASSTYYVECGLNTAAPNDISEWDYVYVTTTGAYAPSAKSDDELAAEEPVMVATSPPATQLLASSPNPVNNSAIIRYQVTQPGAVKIAVYNISGQLVKTLVDAAQPAGSHSVQWDGRDAGGSKVAAGVYFYRLDTGTYSRTNKLTVLR